MKNKIKYVLVLLAVSLLLVSCGKSKSNDYGLYQDINTAKEAAQKNKQDILVVITMEGDDEASTDFVATVLKTEDFKKNISSKYSVVHMDFSQASYEKTVVNPEDSKDAQKASEDYATLMQNNAKYASLMNIQSTPAMMLLTKEVYVITDLEYSEDIKTAADVETLLSSKQSEIEDIHAKVEATKKGSNIEKVQAIDALYDATDPMYQPFLKDLVKDVVSMDKNNESGVLSKYLLAKADSDAADFYLTGDAANASKAYADVCENPHLTPAHKQQAYYLAAYLLSMTGSTDFDTILGYLQKSIEADPESEQVENIKNVIKYFTETLSALNAEDPSGEL